MKTFWNGNGRWSTNKIKPERISEVQASVKIYSSEFDSKMDNVNAYPASPVGAIYS